MVKSRSLRSRDDMVADNLTNVFLFLVGAVSLFPLLFVLSMSLTPFEEVLKNGGYVVFPKKISLDAFHQIIRQRAIPRALSVTVYITVVGTLLSVFFTTIIAYPLSLEKLPGKKGILLFIVFTMLFNGGMIPTYLVVKGLGLTDKLWSLIIPNMVWVYNTMVMRSFFENVPSELRESAGMDGASEFRILYQIILPVSLPVMMTVGLFYMVGYWNVFLQAIIYISDTNLHPLQPVLRKILMASEMPLEAMENVVPSESMKMAAVVASALPIVAVYPFLQKYFVKGMTLGAVKG